MARIKFLRIALVLSIVSLIIIIIAVATPGWQTDSRDNESGLYTPWFEATRAFTLIGLISLAVAVASLVLRVCVASMGERAIVTMLIIIFSWIAVSGLFLTCVIYGAKMKHYLQYSYGMACCSLTIQFVAALLLSIVFVKVKD